MAQNITLLGASYPDVPAVELPKTGGGTATFTDVSPTTATDSDVTSGKIYFKSDGSQSTGTGSGGATYTATITPHSGNVNVYVQHDDTSYYTLDDTFTFRAGDTLTAICRRAYYTYVYVDDVIVVQDYKTDKTASVTYDYTLPAENITIDFSASNTTSRYVKIYTHPSLITKNITADGTYNASDDYADGYSSVIVNVGGGGSLNYDTKTITASNYPTSLSFTDLLGAPKFFAVRYNGQVSSSGSTSYYYIIDVISNCDGTTHGNCFRVGSTRRVDNITSGYSYSYSNGTLTITSSASSRSSSPGAFYSGSYELLYAY